MAEVDDELGMGGDGDGDVGGEELGGFEGDKAVDTDIVGETGVGEDVAVEGDGLAGESFEAVGDEAEGEAACAADGSEAFSADEAAQEGFEGDGALEVIGQAKGLDREGGVTAGALVARYASEGLGEIASFCVSPRGFWCLGMPGTFGIGAKGELLHR